MIRTETTPEQVARLDEPARRAEIDRNIHHSPEGDRSPVHIEDLDGHPCCVGCWWCCGPPTEAHGWGL